MVGMNVVNETIAAIATSLGEAGIGIVRISGTEAITIADQIFESKSGRKIATMNGYQMAYGKIKVCDQVIDEALVALMKAPRSYTGEDVVEFHCHGGIVVLQRVLDLVLSFGARLAERGEFTKRAFLSGRIDLTQAEAVIDMIRSKTNAGLDLAVSQLEGSLSTRIESLRTQLYDIIVRVEAAIDFPEDDIPDVEYHEMAAILHQAKSEIKRLIDTAENGKVFREGIKTVITGKPNVGKSTLLNRLLDEKRALVTDIPGTTRDVIEEVLNLDGIPLRLLDTAGIRKSTDQVEQLGVKKALEVITNADLILHVLDISEEIEAEDRELFTQTKDITKLVIVNKTDLPAKWQGGSYLFANGYIDKSTPVVEISLEKDKLSKITTEIVRLIKAGLVDLHREGAIITRVRHKQALVAALEDIAQALQTIDDDLPLDLISIGIYGALEHLGEITGETVRDNMIEQIFEQFCIGK